MAEKSSDVFRTVRSAMRRICLARARQKLIGKGTDTFRPLCSYGVDGSGNCRAGRTAEPDFHIFITLAHILSMVYIEIVGEDGKYPDCVR
jgi:hypothetical protein